MSTDTLIEESFEKTQSAISPEKVTPPIEPTANKASNNRSRPKLTRTATRFDWPVAVFMAIVHVGALLGFVTFSWQALGVCLFLHWVTGGLGITLCYHRLLTHRSYQTPKWVEYFLSILGSLACQGGPLTWVAVHRLHHAQSDQGFDPHSPRHGFFWAHMGWCLHAVNGVKNLEEKKKLAPDLGKDPVYVWLDKVQLLWTGLLAIGLYAWGGWSFVIWGIFVRLVLVYHTTWFVNSAAHVWGYQNYKSDDESRNLWWVALTTFGEGWHNNHHAFQTSARHGLKWWEIDVTYFTIQIMEKMGLAKNVKLPSKHLLETKAVAA